MLFSNDHHGIPRRCHDCTNVKPSVCVPRLNVDEAIDIDIAWVHPFRYETQTSWG